MHVHPELRRSDATTSSPDILPSPAPVPLLRLLRAALCTVAVDDPDEWSTPVRRTRCFGASGVSHLVLLPIRPVANSTVRTMMAKMCNAAMSITRICTLVGSKDPMERMRTPIPDRTTGNDFHGRPQPHAWSCQLAQRRIGKCFCIGLAGRQNY
jgi:hypothetical protein